MQLVVLSLNFILELIQKYGVAFFLEILTDINSKLIYWDNANIIIFLDDKYGVENEDISRENDRVMKNLTDANVSFELYSVIHPVQNIIDNSVRYVC